MTDHPLFEIVTTTAGAVSIRNKELNEIMHNPVGPWVEANALYIVQSRLAHHLSLPDAEELVVFDVGLGAGANALAALHCALRAHVTRRKLRLVSFERELELLRFALDHADQFPHFAGFTDAIGELLAYGKWSEGGVTWELRHGDFSNQLESEMLRPHIIFYDPYSQKVNREMWTEKGFRELFAHSRSEGTDLYTYSQSTPVRVALLLAGFHVGRGLPTGLKEETTQASSRRENLEFPLDAKWYARWQRSHAKYPYECEVERRPQVERLITNYFQFTT